MNKIQQTYTAKEIILVREIFETSRIGRTLECTEIYSETERKLIVIFIKFAHISTMLMYSISLAVMLGIGHSLIIEKSPRVHLANMPIVKHMTNVGPSPANETHEVIFAVQLNNLDVLEDLVLELATPGSSSYQQWMSAEQVNELVGNPSAVANITSWLDNSNITYQVTYHPRYIVAQAPISVWESAFDTTFYEWAVAQDPLNPSKLTNVHRSSSLSLPTELFNHISTVFNTCEPLSVIRHAARPRSDRPIFKSSIIFDESYTGEGRDISNTRLRREKMQVQGTSVTVSFLDTFYGIPSNLGSASLSQAVFACDTGSANYFSPQDLTSFQTQCGLTQQAALIKNGHTTATCSTTFPCTEGNLDVQYIMGIAQSTVTTYWYVNTGTDPFVTFVTDVASTAQPPTVLSISFGASEVVGDLSSSHTYSHIPSYTSMTLIILYSLFC